MNGKRKTIQSSKILGLFKEKNGVDPQQIILLRSLNSFQFFYNTTNFFIGKQLVFCIQNTIRIKELVNRITNFYDLIRKFQESWFEFKKKIKIAEENLKILWDSVLKEELPKLSSNKKKKKSLTSISKPVRKAILSNYIKECKLKFLKEMQDYNKNKKKIMKNAFMDIYKNPESYFELLKGVKNQIPKLQFSVTSEQMLELIEKALNNKPK